MKSIIRVMSSDLALHFLWSFFLTMILAWPLLSLLGTSGIYYSALIVLALGLIKEFFYDQFLNQGQLSASDMLANILAIGIALAFLQRIII